MLEREELVQSLPAGVPIFGEAGVAEAAALGPELRERLREGVVPRAEALLELGAMRLAALGPQSAAEIEPLYLRAFAAKPRRRG